MVLKKEDNLKIEEQERKRIIKRWVRLNYTNQSNTKMFFSIEKLNRNQKINAHHISLQVTSTKVKFVEIDLFDSNNECVFQRIYPLEILPSTYEKTKVKIEEPNFIAGETIRVKIF